MFPHVCTDLGVENTEIWRFIPEHPDDIPVNTGSYTHNERIERLWRDVMKCVSSMFRNTFQGLYEVGVLDPLYDVDMFCLQYVFKPRIYIIFNILVNSLNITTHCLVKEVNPQINYLFVVSWKVILLLNYQWQHLILLDLVLHLETMLMYHAQHSVLAYH